METTMNTAAAAASAFFGTAAVNFESVSPATLSTCFDAMKPAEKADVDGIVAWVKAGGRLLVFGGEDPYNNLDLWWKKEGCASPHEYLLRTLGIGHSGPARGAGWGPVVHDARIDPPATAGALRDHA